MCPTVIWWFLSPAMSSEAQRGAGNQSPWLQLPLTKLPRGDQGAPGPGS